MRRRAVFLATAFVAMATAAAAANLEPLSDQELKDAFSGNTFSGFHLSTGRTFSEYHHPDGRVIGHNGVEINTDGCWYVRAGAICYAYGKPKDRQHYCFVMHRSGQTMTLTLAQSKRLIGVGAMESGNPRGHAPPTDWSCEDLVSRALAPPAPTFAAGR